MCVVLCYLTLSLLVCPDSYECKCETGVKMQIPATKKKQHSKRLGQLKWKWKLVNHSALAQMLVGTGPSNMNAPGEKANILNQNSETTLLEAVL